MKSLLLLGFALLSLTSLKAQRGQLSSLPAGRYEAHLKQPQQKWSRGDIIILDANRYKVSNEEEIGEYKFSATAQRIFFTSGPLERVYAKAVINGNDPAILLPFTENAQQGMTLAAADVYAVLRKQ